VANRERVRESLSGEPSAEYWAEKRRQGWRPVAIEWEREGSRKVDGAGRPMVEVPYGLMAAPNGAYLVEAPEEHRALTEMLRMIVDDYPLSQVAAELNRQGLRRRSGADWSQVAVFELLPRLIEMAPEITAGEDWIAARRKLHKVAS